MNKLLSTLCIISLLSMSSSYAYGQAKSQYNLPSNFIETDCATPIEPFDMNIALKAESAQKNVSTYYPVVVGDLDGDGFGEIVIPGGTHNSSEYIFIFNHKAELIKQINLPAGCTMHTNYDSVVLSDLDNDDKAEIIVTTSNGQKLFIYNHEGTLLAEESFPTKFAKTVGVADFDNDGIPEIYVGNRIYRYNSANKQLILLARMNNPADDNTLEATMAQDIDSDGIPELISANTTYKIGLTNANGQVGNTITKHAFCSSINEVVPSSSYTTRTFALADIDLNGKIDVITLVPRFGSPSVIELTVWSPQTGTVKYSTTLGSSTLGTYMRNSWPFIGDTDNNGYPDIVFMGGVNKQYHTAVYRYEYDSGLQQVVLRASNNEYNDFSSMSTSMSMFDFNNDGTQEIVYRDEEALYIINGKTLKPLSELTVPNNYSYTGWEYPVVASLTPSGESTIIISSASQKSESSTGTLRLYGANTATSKPWMPARKVWNQFSFYQNTIYDNLKIIANPAPLNLVLTAMDGSNKKMQPFNGHIRQLGLIDPRSLESVYALADLTIESIDYGYDRKNNKLLIDLTINNIGSAGMEPSIPISVYKQEGAVLTPIYTTAVDQVIDVGTTIDINITIDVFQSFYPFDKLVVKIGEGKKDCNLENNEYTIEEDELRSVFFVKKGETGDGSSWQNAMGELSEALQIAEERNTKYPNSINQLWVAQGTYYDTFEMQEGVNIYGGFEGVESDINQSRPLRYPTILDAQEQGRVLTQSDSYTSPTEWRGLTLQNGKTTDRAGGALLKTGGTLSHSLVRYNKTSGTQGAGVHLDNGRLVNSIVDSNEINSAILNEGAGVYAVNNSFVINNTLVNNIANTTSRGTGLFSSQSQSCNNIIYKNGVKTADAFQTDNIYAAGGLVENNLADNDDSIDPLFSNFDLQHYKLLPISPALNAGNNAHIAGVSLDIEGNERVYQNKVVDQGAFEYQSIPLALSEEGYFYVNKEKGGDGSSWENAVSSLEDALTGAKLLNENTPNRVGKIWVSAGSYEGNFEMVEGASVHGGFAGYETDFNQIDTVANKTYIDAQGTGRVLTQTKNFDTPTEWAGMIFQNGNETGLDHDVYGGGAYLKKNGIIRYSTIRNSKAVATSIHNKVSAYGGGVYMESGASLLNSTIDNNLAAVDNTKAETIEWGVAHGGGVNNVGNRLAYLLVQHNKTKSRGDIQGTGIYSSGPIVNSVINANKGFSAIYAKGTMTLVNNTVVNNVGTYTLAGGDGGSKVQNSILYNNEATIKDFYLVQDDETNLVNTNPLFEADSYELSSSSLARTKGRASFFPSDLTVDMKGALRIIALSDALKLIDAGAYQTSIKIKSAKEKLIEVPFDTDFGKIDFKELIEGLLEFDLPFLANIDWQKGSYNQLMDGDYTLYSLLANLSEGVVNPDNVLGEIIVRVKKNHVADLDGLTIDGEDWLSRLEEKYIMDCSTSGDDLQIRLNLPHHATISINPAVEYIQNGDEITFQPPFTKPGSYSCTVHVAAQDGHSTKVYPILFNKYFPFWDIIEQKWNNTFVINNNEENNGAYKFTSYKWYRNDIEIGTKQYHSVGGRRTDMLDEDALYYATMIDRDGVEYTTCKASPVLTNSKIKVTPNPVKAGETLTIEIPGDIATSEVNIYSLSGIATSTQQLTGPITSINAPQIAGLYIVRVSIKGGVSESVRLIVR